jgi:hypothetical protein
MARVQVTAKRRFMQFLITKPANIEVDGVPTAQARWGKAQVVDVPPGRHRVTASFPYFGKKRLGEASVDVDVVEGQVADVTYHTPRIVTNAGTMSVATTSAGPPPPPPPGAPPA